MWSSHWGDFDLGRLGEGVEDFASSEGSSLSRLSARFWSTSSIYIINGNIKNINETRKKNIHRAKETIKMTIKQH